MKQAILIVLLIALAGCRAAAPAQKQYAVTGQVTDVNTARSEVTVNHKDIPGFMPAMTMPYRVKERTLLNGLERGDLISATLVVQDNEAWLSSITKTGHAVPPEETRPTKVMDVMQPGDVVPDDGLTDQDGAARKLSDWRGQALAVTFVYTRCPLPNFCPLMDQHFATVQQAIAADAALRSRVHLVSISFDPEYDTPAVLRAHAQRLKADPRVWSYLTGTPGAIEHVGERFGVSVIREKDEAQTLTHNLRTAVVDPQGRVATIYTGNEWTPDQLIDALRHALSSGSTH